GRGFGFRERRWSGFGWRRNDERRRRRLRNGYDGVLGARSRRAVLGPIEEEDPREHRAGEDEERGDERDDALCSRAVALRAAVDPRWGAGHIGVAGSHDPTL